MTSLPDQEVILHCTRSISAVPHSANSLHFRLNESFVHFSLSCVIFSYVLFPKPEATHLSDDSGGSAARDTTSAMRTS